MFANYKKLFGILTPSEKRKAVIVCLLMVVISVVEVAGVASIMPFIAVLSDPELIQTNPYFAKLYAITGFESAKSFTFFLGILFFCILIAGLIVQAFGAWGLLRFAHMRNYHWSKTLFEGYLKQPYEWFLNRHSAQLVTSVINEVNQVVNKMLVPALQVIASTFTCIMLLVLLVFADPVLAFASGAILGLLFLCMSLVLKARVNRYGEQQLVARRARQMVAQEAFTGVKDVQVQGIESNRVDAFSEPSYTFCRTTINVAAAGQLPHFVTQGFLFGGMFLVLLYLLAFYGGLQDALPIIALFALATYRLLPNIQKIYSNSTTMQGAGPLFDAVSQDIIATREHLEAISQADETDDIEQITLHDSVDLKDVVYRYPGQQRATLDSLNLSVPARSMVGLIGSSGSGKTTILDIILGLLRPSAGSLMVDGQPITDSMISHWRRLIGYVPQQVFLVDDTLTANIAFGIRERDIDVEKVTAAARKANLHDFIESELPEGYATMVGDNGVRLSGGQKQRIGIARALYHDPELLIFDEATSALDSATEKAVMEAITSLGGEKTIILVAHRLSTLEQCDTIYLLDKGKVEASGTYSEVISTGEKLLANDTDTQDINS